jgi:DNA-binding NarL/FixJ family response regulator
VVILDLAMPVMDGATAAAAMVKLRPDVRIIAATGFTAEDILDEARRAGVTSFLAKPFSVDALVEAVRTAGGRKT